MKFRSQFRGAIAGLLFAGALTAPVVLSAATATAAGSSPQAQHEADSARVNTEIRQRLSTYGVQQETADVLVAKLDAGVPWESMSGGKPIRTDDVVIAGEVSQLSTYGDGSIAVSTIGNGTPQAAQIGSNVRGVADCKRGVGSNYHQEYTGCYANVDLVIIQMGFSFDYTGYNGGPGKISRSYDPQYRIIGADLSDRKLIKRSDQVTRYSGALTVAFKGFPAGWTAWMEVDVTKSPITRNN